MYISLYPFRFSWCIYVRKWKSQFFFLTSVGSRHILFDLRAMNKFYQNIIHCPVQRTGATGHKANISYSYKEVIDPKKKKILQRSFLFLFPKLLLLPLSHWLLGSNWNLQVQPKLNLWSPSSLNREKTQHDRHVTFMWIRISIFQSTAARRSAWQRCFFLSFHGHPLICLLIHSPFSLHSLASAPPIFKYPLPFQRSSPCVDIFWWQH